jgi:2'-hydroxyisoflavone reductase
MIRLLVLGGSGFVGPALVGEGLERGWEVATFNRGRSAVQGDPRVRRLRGDRTGPATLGPLADQAWDVVVDTWSGAPTAVRDAVAVLGGRVGHYVYISSASVYAPPLAVGLDEAAPVVAGSPDDRDDGDYARAKRGAELAVVDGMGEHGLLIRAGLILGPGEDVGRLLWWLERMARGGEVLAPGPPQRPLALIDARDLARFALDAAVAGLDGPYNVVSRRGHATMASLLHACADCAGTVDLRLVWATPEVIAGCGIEPWTELPIWLPPGTDYEGMHGCGVERRTRPG